VVIFASMGRDAVVARSILNETGIEGDICRDLPALTRAIADGAGAALVTDEAIRHGDLQALVAWLDDQPAWSDFPFVLLTVRGGGTERNPAAQRLAGLLGNVTFLERPFHPMTLISTVSTALRGRRRQYEARARLEEVREGEDRLRLALQAGRLGSWEIDLDTMTLTSSERCKAIFGLSPDTSLSYAEMLEQIHPADRTRIQDTVAHAVSTGGDFAAENRVIWPDGTIHWVELMARVVFGRDGCAHRMVGVSLDITDRKAADAERDRVNELLEQRVAERTTDVERLSLERQRLVSTVEASSDFIGVAALDGSLLYINRAGRHMVGLTDRDNVTDTAILDYLLPQDRARFADEIMPAAMRDGRWAGEFQFCHLDTGKPIDVHLDFFLIRDPATGQPVNFATVTRDLREPKRVEEQLRQSQKMEAIGQLTGGVAHDFNNLLMAVVGNLDLLRRHMPQNPKLLRFIDGAMQGAQRGAALTQRLLAFARRQDLQPQPVDVVQLVQGMTNLLTRSIGPMIELRLEAAPRMPPAQVDPNQLELALLNLAVNARDAMPDGGKLTIALDHSDESRFLHGEVMPGTYVVLRVSDTGAGMDEATLSRAMEPFFSTKGIGKGTGLGLAMVHGLAVQSNGTLRLRSSPGEGTTAEIWLPTSAIPVRQAEPQPTAVAKAGPATILVVDDDALISMSTTAMLEDLGHVALEASSGAKALKILSGGTRVDLVLTDYAMPGMTGADLALRIRQSHPGLPVLLATGYADLPDGLNIDLPRLGKPYTQRQLATQIAKLLHHMEEEGSQSAPSG
jgi:PAS domain S-box-containing protein